MSTPIPHSSPTPTETLPMWQKQEGRERKEEERRDGGRETGRRKERENNRGRESDCHVFASFLLFDETDRPKCLLSPPKCIFSSFQLHRGFSSSCAHPPANSHEINSTHPSFYLHHLAEAKKNHFAKVPSTGQDISPHCHCTHPSHIQLFKWFGVLWNQRFIPASLTFYQGRFIINMKL